jgi:hypothetical protein
MKRATAYKRQDGWYFHAISRTTVGVGMGTPPRIRLALDASADELGRAVLESLAGSKEGVPHPTPTQGERTFKPMLDLAQVKSWTAFSKHASNVGIQIADEWLVIEPWKNEGPKRGFVQISGASVKIKADSSPADIGEALKQAMGLCQ